MAVSTTTSIPRDARGVAAGARALLPKRSEDRPSVFSQGVWSVLTQGLLLVCGVGTSVILNRVLQPEGRGALAAVMLWPPILAKLSLSGWERANEWHVSRCPQDARGVWASTVSFGLALAVALMAVAGWLLPRMQFPDQRDLWLPLSLMLLMIPLHNIHLANTSVLEGRGLYNRTAILRSGNHIVLLAAMLGLTLWGGLTIVNYIISTLTMLGIVSVLGFVFVVVHTEGSWHPRMFGRFSYIVRVAPYVWIQAFMWRIDLMLLLAILPWTPHTIGVFVASSAVAGLLGPATTGISMVLVPASANRSKDDAILLLQRSLRCYLLVSTPIVITIWLLAGPLLEVAFGAEYEAGAWVLRIAVIGELLLGCLRMGGSYLQGRGRAGTSTSIQLCMFVATILCGVALVSAIGCLGAVLARVCGAIIGILVFLRVSREVRFADTLPRMEDVVGMARRLAVAANRA